MEWKEVLLSEFLEFNPKRTIKKKEVARKITMDLLIPHSKQIYSFKYEPYTGGAKFTNGDTIMARITPCLENGKHAYVSCLNEGEIAYGSTEYIVLCGKNGVSDNEFVYYLSHTPQFVNTAIKSMVGSSGRQRAQVPVLENLIMPVPVNLSDQRKIAGILSALDSKIENNNKINANLESQAQALFKSWFVDFTPFKDQPFVDSELGPIPQGWKVGTLGDIANIIMGQSPVGSSYNECGNGVIFYQGRTEFGFRFPNVRLYTTMPKRYAEPMSILLSVRAPVGDINVAIEKCCIGRGLASISSKRGLHSFLLYLVKSLKNRLEVFNGEGTVFGSINKNTLTQFKIIIPPIEIQEKFNDIIQKHDCMVLELHKEIINLSTQRNTLLPKLMSGEIKL